MEFELDPISDVISNKELIIINNFVVLRAAFDVRSA
jgi:hypothetical protein